MKTKILIIDDEVDILNILQALLETEGYEIVRAVDGVEGIERFEADRPELVITDVKMPKKDGLEVLRYVKEAGRDVDVLILTGHSDEATAIECLRRGAYDYLLKPLEDIDIFLAAVERALGKRDLILKNKELLKQLEEMTIRDPMTGLFNYRRMHSDLDQEISRSRRYGRAFCLLLICVDQLAAPDAAPDKTVRDYVLNKLVGEMKKVLRACDTLYRFGDAEFLTVMPETPEEGAVALAARLRDRIGASEFNCECDVMQITLSMGVAVFPDHADDKTLLLRKAQKAADHARASGGDRAVSAAGLVREAVKA